MTIVSSTQQKASATFTLDAVHISRIARRSRALGMNKSQYLRWLIDRDVDDAAPTPVASEERNADDHGDCRSGST